MALGLEGPTKGFNQADVVIVQSIANKCTVRDYWAQTKDDVRLDNILGGNDNLLNVQCQKNGEYLIANFTRPVSTSDPMDRAISTAQFTDTILAWGATRELTIDDAKYVLEMFSFQIYIVTIKIYLLFMESKLYNMACY